MYYATVVLSHCCSSANVIEPREPHTCNNINKYFPNLFCSNFITNGNVVTTDQSLIPLLILSLVLVSRHVYDYMVIFGFTSLQLLSDIRPVLLIRHYTHCA
jgi:hypothetical protein